MEKETLKIVFWGEDAFSDVILKSLIGAGHKVTLVVTPHYENFIYKRMEMTCRKHGIPLCRTRRVNSDETMEAVASANPDLCVISHFERLIGKPLLEMPPMGFINLHPSLLPDYRGLAPQHWPIINGEKEAGITVHYVDETADTGDIIVQRRFPLEPDMYVSDLQKLWLKHYPSIMVEAIDHILAGMPVKEQRHLAGSYYGKLKAEQCAIDLGGSVWQAYNLVRAVSLPYCGARCGDVVIYRAHVARERETTTNPTFEFCDGLLVADEYKPNKR